MKQFLKDYGILILIILALSVGAWIFSTSGDPIVHEGPDKLQK